MHRILVLGALCGIAAGAQAQVYKCVDASGNTTYLQSPCPTGAKSSAISRTVPPAPAAAPATGSGAPDKAAKASGPKTAAEMELDYRKRKQEEEKQREKEQQKLADSKATEENCRNSKAQLASLESGMRQMRFNAQGQPEALDEAQVEQAKANARRLVDQWCR